MFSAIDALFSVGCGRATNENIGPFEAVFPPAVSRDGKILAWPITSTLAF